MERSALTDPWPHKLKEVSLVDDRRVHVQARQRAPPPLPAHRHRETHPDRFVRASRALAQLDPQQRAATSRSGALGQHQRERLGEIDDALLSLTETIAAQLQEASTSSRARTWASLTHQRAVRVIADKEQAQRQRPKGADGRQQRTLLQERELRQDLSPGEERG